MRSEELRQEFEHLPKLQSQHIEYLKNRGIDYELVKDVVKCDGDYICCQLLGVDENNEIDYITFQKRHINPPSKDKRFDLPPKSKSDGIFIGSLDRDKDYIIIVEGMFDFLSIYQFDHNVVGLFNASTKGAIQVIKKIIDNGNIKKIFMVPDNDLAGETALKNCQETLGLIGTTRLDLYGVKDVNELVIKMGKDFDIKDFISLMNLNLYEQKKQRIKEVDTERKKLLEDIDILDQSFTQGNPIERSVPILNDEFKPILPNEMVVLVGAAGSGKTTFTFSMIRHNLQRHKIGLLSYEMRVKDIRNNYLAWKIPGGMDRMMNAAMTKEDQKLLKEYSEPIFGNPNLYFSENLDASIDDVESDIRKFYDVGVRVFIIDNLVKIRGKSKNEFKDNEAVIKLLYGLCKSLNICVILLHHADKGSSSKKSKAIVYRGSGNIQNAVDRMVIMSRPAVHKEFPAEDEKAQVDFFQAKQRYGGMGMGKRESVYYHKADYYSDLDSWMIAKGITKEWLRENYNKTKQQQKDNE